MRPRRAMMVLAAITLPLAPLPLVTASASPQPAPVALDDVLPGGGSGQKAIDELGPALDETAADNGLSTDAFTEILQNDTTAHLDEGGRLYYVEPVAPAPPGTRPAPAASMLDQASPEVAAAGLTIPALHSRPTSAHTIYLDFDGYTLDSTSAWTSETVNPIPAGTYGGFTLDGSPDFSADEIAFITKVQKIVAEKYAPFDVDVTTEAPTADAIRRTSASDPTYGVQVVITNDPAPVNAVCGGSCAGIAYTGVFDRPESPSDGGKLFTPAWVFSSKTQGSAQLTAHDAAHEVGHTFGLHHDGTVAHDAVPANGYYGGQANWVPIMGITNQKAVAQFSIGEYAYANNKSEDDLAVIGANGFDGSPGSLLLIDDYPGGPFPINAQTGYALDGVISGATDNDTFSLVWPCNLPMTVSATGIGAGQSVDLKVTVLDDGGHPMASNDPPSGQQSVAGDLGYAPTGMDATVTIPGADPGQAGLLRGIIVEGVGSGDAATTGYSSYGSIGRYRLEISGCPNLGQPDAPGNVAASQNPRTNTGTITWSAPTPSAMSPAATGYRIEGLPGGNVTVGNQLTYTATGLVPGTTYDKLAVRAININGAGPAAPVTLRIGTWSPTASPGLSVTGSGSTAVLRWSALPNPGLASLTGWRIRGSGPGEALDLPAAANVGVFTISGLAPGTHTFTVTPLYSAEDGGSAPVSNPASVLLATAPAAPRIGLAAPGKAGRPITATAKWSPPANTGGLPITSYRVLAYKLNSRGKVAQTLTKIVPATARSVVWKLPAAKYKFRVIANNGVGASAPSAYSRIVAAR